MPTFIMSTPPVMGEPVSHVMCDVCGNVAHEWIGLRIIVDLVYLCTDCLGAMIQANHEMRRQWVEWRENSDYAPRPR